MSEINEEIILDLYDKDSKDFIPKEFNSPSSINTYYNCPLKYFLTYIAKIKPEPNINLLKGSIIHITLEMFFKKYIHDIPLKEILLTLFEKYWSSNEDNLKKLELSDEDLTKEKTDCINMLNMYLYMFEMKIKILLESGKAENQQHAFHLLKPKFREFFVKNNDVHCLGYIDRIDKDFDGLITIGDYKTSKKYGIGISEDYRRQLSIYSYLYYLQTKEIPDFASVIFLRYGETFSFEITPTVFEYARNSILEVYKKTRSINIKDYPKKENNLCSWCQFQSLCSGEEVFKKELRLEKIKKLLEERK